MVKRTSVAYMDIMHERHFPITAKLYNPEGFWQFESSGFTHNVKLNSANQLTWQEKPFQHLLYVNLGRLNILDYMYSFTSDAINQILTLCQNYQQII